MIRSKFNHFARVFSMLLGILALAAGNLMAQNTTGTLRGNVTGEGGAPIGSAQIIARNVNSGAVRTTMSSDAGGYALVGLTPGTYDISVRRIGSSPENRRVVIQIGATQSQDFALASQAATLETQVVTATTGTETRRRAATSWISRRLHRASPSPRIVSAELPELFRPADNRRPLSIFSSTERASRTSSHRAELRVRMQAAAIRFRAARSRSTV
jgi:hypothetical protein